MSKRSLLRILAGLAALVAAVAASAQTALAVNFDVGSSGGSEGQDPSAMYPIVPPPAPRPLLPASSAQDASVAVGVTWQLAIAAVLFVLAVALFVAASFQRRHAAHP